LTGVDLTTTLTTSIEEHTITDALGDQLFVVLYADRPLTPPSRHSLIGIDEVVFRRGAEIHVVRDGRRLELQLPDPRVSGEHARMSRGFATWYIEDLGSKNGTFVGPERTSGRVAVHDGAAFSVGHTFLLLRTGRSFTGPADLVAHRGALPEGLETLSCDLAARIHALARVVQTDTAVLVLGESGTGKERIAHAVHALAGRKGELVPLNCGGVPASLMPSELFGHKRGAFSGAEADRTGVVVAANHGTLFLDEIGDLPLEVQPALLRVLQEREVTPIGATRPIPVDLRIVCATHRVLATDVELGKFRRDLYARIAGYTLLLPPLRDRREDLGLIVGELLRRHAPDRRDVSLARTSALSLFTHSWPQNVRELENALKVALAVAGEGPVRLELAPPPVTGERPLEPTPSAGSPPATTRADRRSIELRRLLEEHGGNVAAVARAMGKQRTQIHRWLKDYGIDPEAFRK
jgi:transcriptional regulator of acetoin/glycerol metabolism